MDPWITFQWENHHGVPWYRRIASQEAKVFESKWAKPAKDQQIYGHLSDRAGNHKQPSMSMGQNLRPRKSQTNWWFRMVYDG